MKVREREREKELDLARSLAILFMIAIHTLQSFDTSNFIDSYFYRSILFLGGVPAAPVFMVLMGISLVYSQNKKASYLFKRGLKLILLGYILNFFREGIFYIIYWLMEGGDKLSYYITDSIISVDILHFAGLSLIFFAILRFFKIEAFLIFFLILFASINYFLRDIKVEGLYLRGISSLIWASSDSAYFPFLTWINYPILGYYYGTYLYKVEDKDRFYQLNLAISSVMSCFIYFIIKTYTHMELSFGGDYSYLQHNFLTSTLFFFLVTLLLSIYFFSVKVMPKYILSYAELFSKNSIYIFFIHWLLISSILLVDDLYSISYIENLQITRYFFLYFIITITSYTLSLKNYNFSR